MRCALFWRVAKSYSISRVALADMEIVTREIVNPE